MEAEKRYEVREVIGKGAFGDVYLVVEKETKHKYVLKRIKMARQSEWQRKATRQEIDIVSRLRHPFIMPYKEHWTHHGHTINVVYGYCEKGDLTTAVAKQKGKPFPEETLRLWLAQLLLAVDYMHRQSVLHRDIKTQNILLTGDGDVQLGDFGLSTVRVSGASAVVIGAAEGGVQPQDDVEPASDVEQQPDVLPKTPEPCDPGGGDAPHGQRLQLKLEPLDKPSGTLNDYALVGTPHFMSPELLSNHKYGYETDIWSLGIVFYELSAMKPPFNAFNLAGLVQKIKRATLPPIPSHYSAEWSTVLKSMLRKDPGRRASPLEILSSPCMAAAVAQARQRALAIDPTVELPVCDTVASLPSDLPSPSCSPLPSPIGSNGTGFSFGSAAAADSFPCSGTPSFPTPPSSGVAVTPTLAHRHEPSSGSSTPDATTHAGRSTVPDLEQAAASRGASLTARPTPAATPSAKASTTSARAQSLPRGTGPATSTPARRHQTPPGRLGLRVAATQPATSAAKGRTSISGAATAATPRTAAAKAAGADERKLASTPSVRRLTSRGGADKDGTRGTVSAVPLQEATPEAAKASPAACISVSGAVAAGTASALRAAPATTSAVRAELHHGDSRAQGVPSLRSRRGLLDNHIPVVSVPPTPSAPALQASPLPSPEAPRSTRTPDALSSGAGLVAAGEPHAVPDAGGPPTPTWAELIKSPTAMYACNGRTPPGKSGVAAGPTAGARPRVSHGGVSHGGGAANRGLARTAQPQTPPPAAAAAAANAAGPSAGPTPRASRPLAKRPADGTTAAATPRQVVGRVAASPLHVAAGTRRLPSANGAEQQAAQQPEKRLRRVSVSRTNGDAPAGKAPVPAVAVGSNQQTDAAPLPQQAAQPGSAPPNGAAAFVCRAASDGGAGMEEQPSSPARSEGRPGGAENASQPHAGAQALASEGSDLSIPSGRYPQVDALGNRADTPSVRAARTHLWDNQLFLGQAASPGPQLTASGSPRKDDNPCAPGRQSEAYADMLQTAGSGTVDALPRRVSISAFTSCATPLGAQGPNVSTQQAPVEVPLHRGSRLAAVLASNDMSSRLSVDVLTPPGFKPLSDEDVTPYGRSTGTPAPSTLVGDSAGTPTPMLPTQQVNAATTRSVPGRDSHSGQSPAASLSSVSESPPSASTPSPCASRGTAQDSGQSHSLAVGNATLGTPLPVPGRLIGAGNHGDGSCDSPSTASAQRSFAGFHVHQPPSPSAWPASTHGLSRGHVTGGACAAATSTDSDAATVSPSPCRLGDVLEAASEGHEEEVQSPLQQHPVAADAAGYGVATNTETARLIQLERMVSLCQSLVEEGRLVELVSILSSNLSRQLRVPQGWLQLATAGSDSSGGSGGGNPAAAAAHGRAATGISPVVKGKARRPSGRGPLRTAHQLAAPVGLHHRGPDHGAGARAEADQGGSQVVELGMAARVTAGPLKGAEGVVRFRGPCHWSRGTIIGLELRKPLSATAAAALHAASGDKDSPDTGRRDGLTYFECRQGYGVFVLAEHVATT